MLAGHERERLVGALAELRAELGVAGVAQPSRRPEAGAIGPELCEEDEALVAEVAAELATLAAAMAATHPPVEPLSGGISVGAVAGAEWVMRSTILREGPAAVARLVPDFVYLVTLPFLGEAGSQKAAEVSRRLIGVREEEG